MTLILWMLVYFIPTFLGWDKKNRVGIFALNLLLGWTIVCWIIALVWALKQDNK